MNSHRVKLPDQTGVSESNWIDMVGDQFERELRDSPSCRLPEYLIACPPVLKQNLLVELLLVKWDCLGVSTNPPPPLAECEEFPEWSELIQTTWEEYLQVLAEETAEVVSTVNPVNIRCPDCSRLVAVLPEESLKSVRCRFCGSTFHLVQDHERPPEGGRSLRLGQFELREQLGAGAFGTVWKAWDTRLERWVACKVPRASLLTELEQEQFFREARAAAQLHHEHIVSVHEVGRSGETIYIVSDYVEGSTLTNSLLDPCNAANLLQQIATALEHAHQQGVIHRDLKPGNIMQDVQGKPYVMDFGLAKRNTGEVTLTLSGDILGTPAYMSPEQACGDAHLVDARSDVYSLGVILFELLTGEHPFRGNVQMLLHQVLHEEPPSPRKLNAQIPLDLETICLKCLEKTPERRYQSAAAFAEDLNRYLSGFPITARPVSRLDRLWRMVKRNPVLASALTAIVVLLLVLGIGGPIAALQQLVLKQDVLDANADLSKALVEEANAKAEAETARATEREQRERAEKREKEAVHRLYLSKIARSETALIAGDYAAAARTLNSIPLKSRKWEADWLSRQARGSLLTLQDRVGGPRCVAIDPSSLKVACGTLYRTISLWDLRTGELLRTIAAHDGEVTCLAFSPDGSRLISGGTDQTLRIWNAVTGEQVFELPGHLGSILTLAVSPDGTKIISGGYDKTVRGWDALTGEPLFNRRKHRSQITSLSFSPDGNRFVSGSKDETVWVWDTRAAQPLFQLADEFEFQSGPGSLVAVRYTPDGLRIVTGAAHRIDCWNSESGKKLLSFSHGPARIIDLALSPDGSRIITSGSDTALTIRDSFTGKELFQLKGHQGQINSVVVSADARQIVSASSDGSVKIWENQPHQQRVSFENTKARLECLAVSPGEHLLAGGSRENQIFVWDADSGDLLHTLTGHKGSIEDIQFSPNGTQLVSSSRDNQMKLWNLQTGKELRSFSGHSDRVWCVAFSPDGTHLASGSRDRTVRLWKTETGEELTRIEKCWSSRNGLIFHPDNVHVICSSDSGSIQVLNIRTGQIVNTLKMNVDAVTPTVARLALNSQGSLLAAGGSGGLIRIWETENWTELVVTGGNQNLNSGLLHALIFTADGTRLLCAGEDQLVRVYEAVSGELLITLREHEAAVLDLAFSDEGSSLFSLAADSMVIKWETCLVEQVLTFPGHRGIAWDRAIAPNGSLLVSGGEDQFVKIWDIERAELRQVLKGHQRGVWKVGFSPDGTRVISREIDQVLRVWDNETGKLIRTEELKNPEQLSQRFLELIGEQRTRIKDREVIAPRVGVKQLNPVYNPWSEEQRLQSRRKHLWHTAQTALSTRNQRWFAARFHLQQLLQMAPDDYQLKERMQQVETKWNEQSARESRVSNPQ